MTFQRRNYSHKGLANPNARLHPVLVWQIIQGHKQGRGYKKLAKTFLVSPSTIRDIIKGKTWTAIDYTPQGASNKSKRPAPGEGGIFVE